jgi:ferritin-like metal-binding protein YciE
MNASETKVAQYLGEARASEQALIRVLQAQIAMTPRGRYRTALERHLRETRTHADLLGDRLAELGRDEHPLQAVLGVAQEVVGQALALGKTPLDLVRGSGGEEKVLKNAKDACATEALEIATYTAIERLARAVGDDDTAELATTIRAEEEAMLACILDEIPQLADAVVSADVRGDGSYDIRATGAGEAVADVREQAGKAARSTVSNARRAARGARRVPGVAEAEGAVASVEDLPIAGYDGRTAEEIAARLPGLSQVDLAKVDAYERRNDDRATIRDRIASLRGEEPWPGYDDLNAGDVQARLRDGDDELARAVRTYERAHKDRVSVLQATERELARTA